jgi:mono/diheme cytochrome c family protein
MIGNISTMKNIQSISGLFVAAIVLLAFSSCQTAEGNQTGSEFIPDMAHSIAYEANVYGNYSLNTFSEESDVDRKSLTANKLPVKGTVPRGYAGQVAPIGDNGIKVPANGHVPYYYDDTEEERTRATNEIINAPFPITANGLEKGKELYNIFCGICHGEKGDGLGYLVRDDGGKYPAAPANFLLDEFVNATNGRYYHGIMYGKNVMGGYADKLSYEERWQVIHWIRALQAKDRKLQYDENANTLNNWAVAGVNVKEEMQVAEVVEEPAAEEGDHSHSEGGNH